jgi:L-malate glycosyltransferase
VQPKILHMVYSLIRGGTEGQCARAIVELARSGAGQRVAVSRREGFFLDAVEKVCGPAFELGISRMASPATALRILALRNFMRREAFDVVHAWDADAAIFGAAGARLAGVPCITSRRDLGQIYAPAKLRLMSWADRRASAIVVNARAVGDALFREGPLTGKVRLVTNILDLDEFDRLAEQPLPPAVRLPPGPLVGMVARLDPEKDAATFLRAAEAVSAKRPDATFVLAGDGPERHRLEVMAGQLGAAARVHFLGDVTCVPALVRRLSVGVLTPSTNEGLSNSILEYMAARLPVVATDCGGNRELVEAGATGFVTDAGDGRAVGDRILRLLGDAGLARRMGEAGRRRVVERHSPSAVAAQFLELYRATAGAGS